MVYCITSNKEDMTDLEPAERNPAEMRRTAFILIMVMTVGAFFILAAYKRHEASRDPNRPPIVSQVKKNLAAKNQDGKLVSLSDYEGKVWFVAPVCVSQLDENKHALAMMQELEKHYRENDQVGFALISIEGADQGVGSEELKIAADELGFDSSRVQLLTTGKTKKQRGYLKNQLRLGIVSERLASEVGKSGGKWKFPSQLALLDKEMHLRQRYDFKEAHEVQAMAEQKATEDPSIKEKEGFDNVIYAVRELKKILYINTEYILKEVSTGSQK